MSLRKEAQKQNKCNAEKNHPERDRPAVTLAGVQRRIQQRESKEVVKQKIRKVEPQAPPRGSCLTIDLIIRMWIELKRPQR